MDAFQVRFAAELRNKLEVRIVELNTKLVSAMAADYASYTERVGLIKGLKEALQTAIDIEAELGKPDDRPKAAAIQIRQGYET